MPALNLQPRYKIAPTTTIDAKIESLDIDEIKQRLEPLMIGFHIQCPIFDAGRLCTARRLGPLFRKDVGTTRAV